MELDADEPRKFQEKRSERPWPLWGRGELWKPPRNSFPIPGMVFPYLSHQTVLSHAGFHTAGGSVRGLVAAELDLCVLLAPRRAHGVGRLGALWPGRAELRKPCQTGGGGGGITPNISAIWCVWFGECLLRSMLGAHPFRTAIHPKKPFHMHQRVCTSNHWMAHGQATKFTFRFQEDLPRYCRALGDGSQWELSIGGCPC